MNSLLHWSRQQGIDIDSHRWVALDMLSEIAALAHISTRNRSNTLNAIISMTQNGSLHVPLRTHFMKELISGHEQGRFIDVPREDYYFSLRAAVDRLSIESENELDEADLRLFDTFLSRARGPQSSPEPSASSSSSTQSLTQPTTVAISARQASSAESEASRLTEAAGDLDAAARPQQATVQQNRSIAGEQTVLRVLNSQIQDLLHKQVAHEIRLNIFRNVVQDHSLLTTEHKDDLLTIAEQWQDPASVPIVVKLLKENAHHYSEEQKDRISGLILDLHENEDALRFLFS